MRLENEGDGHDIKPEITILSEAEGWEKGSNRYEVAVLAVKSYAIGRLYSEIRAGNYVVGPIGKSIEESVRSYHGVVCGSRLLFDETGCPWFIGSTTRSIERKNPIDSISRKSRGVTDLFAMNYALSGILGEKFAFSKVSGVRKLMSDIMIGEMISGLRYYSVYGVSAKDLSLSCKTFVQEQNKIVDNPKEEISESSNENSSQVLKKAANLENMQPKEKCLNKKCINENNAEEIKKIKAPLETNLVSIAGVEPLPIRELVELCKNQGWSIGWDVAKSRIMQLGYSEFKTEKGESDDLFFKKRHIAMRQAFLNAVIKISCLLSFDIKMYSDDSLYLFVKGATLMKFSEGYDSVSRRYYVATLVTWSKTLERVANSLLTGDELSVKPGQKTFASWLERQNPMHIGLAQKYIDQNGVCWAISAIPFSWSDSFNSDTRSKQLDYVESSLAEMLLLGCNVSAVVPQKDYLRIKKMLQSLADEHEIDECLSTMKVELKDVPEKVKGAREMIDVFMVHHPSKRKARVFVYATNVNLVRNAKD